MNPSLKFVLIVLTVSLAFAGCKDGGANKPKSASEREYDVKGKVTALNTSKPAVTLDHEDIPGLMKAMEMEFQVENSKVLEGIKVGDQVQGRLKKAYSGYTITHLGKR